MVDFGKFNPNIIASVDLVQAVFPNQPRSVSVQIPQVAKEKSLLVTKFLFAVPSEY
jgi:hypothetical protein